MLFDQNDKPLKWLYFQHLVNIQDKIGLHDGKKIQKRCITDFKEEIKVKLAAQTFSKKRWNVLEFFSKSLNLNEFN